MATYEETLVNITLDAAAGIAVDTSQPYVGRAAPDGGSAAAGFQYRFVALSGRHECDLYDGVAATGLVVGVLQNKPQVEGAAATVAIHGITMVEAAGAIGDGAAVGADATGRATAGGDLGYAVEAATEAGQIIPVLLRIN